MVNRSKESNSGSLLKLPNLKDNFNLSKKEFDAFVMQLKQGDSSMFTTVFNEQFQESVQYISSKFNISSDVAYDACMDTMIVFRDKIMEDKIKYGNMRYLFTRMAANTYLDNIKRNKRINTAIAVFTNDDKNVNQDKEGFFNKLDSVVNQLNEEHKSLINDLFYSTKSLEQIASEKNIAYATLRKRKERVLTRLRDRYFSI